MKNHPCGCTSRLQVENGDDGPRKRSSSTKTHVHPLAVLRCWNSNGAKRPAGERGCPENASPFRGHRRRFPTHNRDVHPRANACKLRHSLERPSALPVSAVDGHWPGERFAFYDDYNSANWQGRWPEHAVRPGSAPATRYMRLPCPASPVDSHGRRRPDFPHRIDRRGRDAHATRGQDARATFCPRDTRAGRPRHVKRPRHVTGECRFSEKPLSLAGGFPYNAGLGGRESFYARDV